MLNTLLSLLILFSVKESKMAVSCALGNGPGEVGVVQEDIAYGPQDFEVDWEENIYVLDSYNHGRIMKFDANGVLLFTITPKEFSPSGLAVDSKNNLIIPASSPKGFFLVRYTPDGKLSKISSVPRALSIPVIPDLRGKIYFDQVDSVIVFDEEFNYLETFKGSEFNRTMPRGYAQWSDWVKFKMDKDTVTGKYNLGLRNSKSKQEIAIKHPPGRISYGFIEGMDKNGNVYFAGFDEAARQGIFFRINPTLQTIDTLRVEQKAIGDLGHALFISPNGDIYMACLVKEAKKLKWYRIYRYSKNLFARME